MVPSASAAPSPAAGPPVRLLHLEDQEDDHALVLLALRRGGLVVQATRVETRDAFLAALDQTWDVVLSDYHLPGFNGVQALQLLQAWRQRVEPARSTLPFILVSGQIGEDTAVEAMRHGAADYLLKNRLQRLAPAVEQAMASARVRREKFAADAELRASRLQLRQLAQHLQSSVEAERLALARDVHDDLGGALTALKFELDGIRRHAGDEALRRRAQSALETCLGAIESTQRLLQNLRPTVLEQGLVPALQWLVQQFTRRSGVRCELRLSPALARAAEDPGALVLPDALPLVAYRTVQEALTNVHKHAQATQVVVDLSAGGGVLSLEIADNGRGLSPDDLAKARSFGLRGLQERAHAVGGWLDVSSPAGRGTTLLLSVPLAADDDAGPAAGGEDAADGLPPPLAASGDNLPSPPAAPRPAGS